nr:hypothetical protein [uncultured Proteiniphilum sp.]
MILCLSFRVSIFIHFTRCAVSLPVPELLYSLYLAVFLFSGLRQGKKPDNRREMPGWGCESDR